MDTFREPVLCYAEAISGQAPFHSDDFLVIIYFARGGTALSRPVVSEDTVERHDCKLKETEPCIH